MAKRKVTKEQLMALRNEKEMSNQEIADELQISINTVVRHIGRQPAHITEREREKGRAAAKETRERNKALKAAEAAPVIEPEPQEQPKEEPAPAEPVKVEPVAAETPKPTTARRFIATKLFDFAYIPAWFDHLGILAKAAQPEPWSFIEPPETLKNKDTHILENYIGRVFTKLAYAFNTSTPEAADRIICIRDRVACFNTGLYDPNFKSLYAIFSRNLDRETNSKLHWRFQEFSTDSSPYLKSVYPLPLPPLVMLDVPPVFQPGKDIRISTNHILTNPKNVARLPKSVQAAWNAPLLLETAVEMSRRRVIGEMHLVAPVHTLRGPRYLLPLYLTNMETPDLAMCLEDVGDYYGCGTLLTRNMAYLEARLIGRPNVQWLTDGVV